MNARWANRCFFVSELCGVILQGSRENCDNGMFAVNQIRAYCSSSPTLGLIGTINLSYISAHVGAYITLWPADRFVRQYKFSG